MKNEIFDKEPWYKNHNSPFSKWLLNLSMIGFYLTKKGSLFGCLWFVFF